MQHFTIAAFLKKLVAGPDVGETPAEEQQEK
jgi:hypothetical protein